MLQKGRNLICGHDMTYRSRLDCSARHPEVTRRSFTFDDHDAARLVNGGCARGSIMTEATQQNGGHVLTKMCRS